MARTDESNPWVIAVEAGHALLPCSREKRCRRGAAYLIYDAKSGTQLIAQKLQHAAMYINRQLATAERERNESVSPCRACMRQQTRMAIASMAFTRCAIAYSGAISRRRTRFSTKHAIMCSVR